MSGTMSDTNTIPKMEDIQYQELHDMIALMNVTIGMQHHHTDRMATIPICDIVGGIVSEEEANERTFPVLDALANICVFKLKGQVVAVALQLDLEAKRICLTLAENETVEDKPVIYLAKIWRMLKILASRYAERREETSERDYWRDFLDVSPEMPDGIGRDLRINIFRQIYCYTRDKDQLRIAKHWPPLCAFMEKFFKTRLAQQDENELDLTTAFQALKFAIEDYNCIPVNQQNKKYWENLFAYLEVASYRVKRIAGEKNYWCDNLVVEEDPDALTVFNLRHALLKLTSQHRHFQTLIAFAHSPRLNPAFQCHMSIRTVPASIPRIVSLSWTTSQWKDTIENIVPKTDIGGLNLNWQEEEALKLGEKFDSPSERSAHMHAECALIQHLRMEHEEGKRSRSIVQEQSASASHKKRNCGSERGRESQGVGNVFFEVGSKREGESYIESGESVVGSNIDAGLSGASGSSSKDLESDSKVYSEEGKKVESRRTTESDLFKSKRTQEEMENQSGTEGWEMVRAFSYIGVSKLSCAACKIWIEGYNQQEGPNFYTRGCHGKWYWPWGLPELNQDVLSKYMVKRITSTYRQHCRAKGWIKKLSNGSTAAATRPTSPDSVDQLAFESRLKSESNRV